MKERTLEEPETATGVEGEKESVRAQAAADEVFLEAPPPEIADVPTICQFITISREAGASGSHVAGILGQRLGWEVLDKSILDSLADRYNISRPALEAVDETTVSWVYNIFGTWLDREIISHEKYLTRINRIFLEEAKRGKAIFVGRGAQFLLPRDQQFAVRLIASKKYRVEQLVRRYSLTTGQAHKTMQQLDRGREHFVRYFFHQDINDPHIYDQVINVERFGPAETAEKIIRMVTP